MTIEGGLADYDELDSLLIAAFDPATERAFKTALRAVRIRGGSPSVG